MYKISLTFKNKSHLDILLDTVLKGKFQLYLTRKELVGSPIVNEIICKLLFINPKLIEQCIEDDPLKVEIIKSFLDSIEKDIVEKIGIDELIKNIAYPYKISNKTIKMIRENYKKNCEYKVFCFPYIHNERKIIYKINFFAKISKYIGIDKIDIFVENVIFGKEHLINIYESEEEKDICVEIDFEKEVYIWTLESLIIHGKHNLCNSYLSIEKVKVINNIYKQILINGIKSKCLIDTEFIIKEYMWPYDNIRNILAKVPKDVFEKIDKYKYIKKIAYPYIIEDELIFKLIKQKKEDILSENCLIVNTYENYADKERDLMYRVELYCRVNDVGIIEDLSATPKLESIEFYNESIN